MLCPGICFLYSLANIPPVPSTPITILAANALLGANLGFATIDTSVSSLASSLSNVISTVSFLLAFQSVLGSAMLANTSLSAIFIFSANAPSANVSRLIMFAIFIFLSYHFSV